MTTKTHARGARPVGDDQQLLGQIAQTAMLVTNAEIEGAPTARLVKMLDGLLAQANERGLTEQAAVAARHGHSEAAVSDDESPHLTGSRLPRRTIRGKVTVSGRAPHAHAARRVRSNPRKNLSTEQPAAATAATAASTSTRTPVILQHTALQVYRGLHKKEPDPKRRRLSAFAIATSGLQDAGVMTPGSRKLTRYGRRIEREHVREDPEILSRKLNAYERMLRAGDYDAQIANEPPPRKNPTMNILDQIRTTARKAAEFRLSGAIPQASHLDAELERLYRQAARAGIDEDDAYLAEEEGRQSASRENPRSKSGRDTHMRGSKGLALCGQRLYPDTTVDSDPTCYYCSLERSKIRDGLVAHAQQLRAKGSNGGRQNGGRQNGARSNSGGARYRVDEYGKGQPHFFTSLSAAKAWADANNRAAGGRSKARWRGPSNDEWTSDDSDFHIVLVTGGLLKHPPTLAGVQRRNPDKGLFASIRPGDSVTIHTRHGSEVTGRAMMRGPAGWVLSHGRGGSTPVIADESNVVRVRHSRRNPSDDDDAPRWINLPPDVAEMGTHWWYGQGDPLYAVISRYYARGYVVWDVSGSRTLIEASADEIDALKRMAQESMDSDETTEDEEYAAYSVIHEGVLEDIGEGPE